VATPTNQSKQNKKEDEKIASRCRADFLTCDRRDDVDGDLEAIKLKIPTFQGKKHPEEYLQWD